jgi:hypothetical protein
MTENHQNAETPGMASLQEHLWRQSHQNKKGNHKDCPYRKIHIVTKHLDDFKKS